MSRLLIPLHLRLPAPRSGRSPDLTLTAGEGRTLLTRDSFDAAIKTFQELDKPRFHVFDTEAEARAAYLLLSHESERVARTSRIGRMRDGEGVLMLSDPEVGIEDDGFEITDNRNGACRQNIVYGSWELTGPECDEILNAQAGMHRSDLANAVSGKVGSLPAELVREVQIALERIPGAYVGFVSVSPEEVRADYRLDGISPDRLPDALIQPYLDRASVKAELADAHNEAVDATVERLLEAHPDLIQNDPEP
jgi:hypothetical protein